jgi:hypothetical protein
MSEEVRIEKRNTKTEFLIRRKHDEDKDLPLFIRARRKQGKIIGYRVDFPIPNSVTYENQDFTCVKPTSEKLDDLLNKAKFHIDELKKKHNFNESDMNVRKIVTSSNVNIDVDIDVDDDVDDDLNIHCNENITVKEISKRYKVKDYKPYLAERKIDGIVGGYVVKYKDENGRLKDKPYFSVVLDEAKQRAESFLEDKLNGYNNHHENDEKSVENNTQEIDLEKRLEKFVKIKTEKQLKKLPQYIYPIYAKVKMIGYYIEGYPDHEGKPFPKKEFKDYSTTTKALFAANNYIKELEIRNKDSVFVEFIPDDIKKAGYEGDNSRRKDDSTKKLPKNITYVTVNNKNVGYQINNFQLQGKMIKKKICDTHETMECKYNKTLDHLRDLIKQKEQYKLDNNKLSNNDHSSQQQA